MTAVAQTTDTLRVQLGARSYDIAVGPGLLDDAAARLKPVLKRDRVFVVTEGTVAPLYLARLEAALDKAGIAVAHTVIEPGEASKDFAHLEAVIDAMLRAGCERSTTVVALGGGVVGDLAGFAASVALRGVDFVQIPTTLLAQVDSSVGGKTGINTRLGKNLVGAFHQPRLVLIDTDTLDTLPERVVRAGYAEVVKYGLIDDAAFFDWLEQGGGQRVIDGDQEARRRAILTSCTAKARVVAEDERETGRRALLNLGHTFGHALEAEAGYADDVLMHGEAVAIGMVLAFALSARMGLCPPADAERLRAHLDAVGLPTTARQAADMAGRSFQAARLVAHMARDKKVEAGTITFVLAKGIGHAHLEREVTMDDVHAVIEDSLG